MTYDFRFLFNPTVLIWHSCYKISIKLTYSKKTYSRTRTCSFFCRWHQCRPSLQKPPNDNFWGFFTGRISSLLSNQQCQSTEGIWKRWTNKL